MAIIIIVGQTATGKSDLAVELALRYSGEVVSADSRQVYTGLNVGSNKITESETRGVPHWGLDLVRPGERYTVAQFQSYARSHIADILSRNKTPIIVGGTGLYSDAVMFKEFAFGERAKGSIDYTNAQIWNPYSDNKEHHPEPVSGSSNSSTTTRPGSQTTFGMTEGSTAVYWIGLHAPREYLIDRIRARAVRNIHPISAEIRTLLDNGVPRDWLYGLGLEYRYGTELLEGTLNESQYIELITTKTWQYARRQMTWFKRNPRIHWFDISTTSPKDIIDSLLQQKQR